MGFTADWLALREPADRQARDGRLLRQAARSAGPTPVILDLGCGTGATFRALAPFLPETATWRLLDSDMALLERAKAAVGCSARTYQQDLRMVQDLPLNGVTLVTASALLDLVSEPWLASLVSRLEVPFYAALSYDGIMHWTPESPQDAAITAAFNRHQQTDKGFGPALGPNAPDRAVALFQNAGFDVETATSPWQLTPETAQLQNELVDGIAKAADEANALDAQKWQASKQAAAHKASCVVGHVDILAIPVK